jgi:hypothetical protein
MLAWAGPEPWAGQAASCCCWASHVQQQQVAHVLLWWRASWQAVGRWRWCAEAVLVVVLLVVVP